MMYVMKEAQHYKEAKHMMETLQALQASATQEQVVVITITALAIIAIIAIWMQRTINIMQTWSDEYFAVETVDLTTSMNNALELLFERGIRCNDSFVQRMSECTSYDEIVELSNAIIKMNRVAW